MGFWERWSPQKAAEVVARKTYAVERRGSITNGDEASEHILHYYPRSDSAELAAVHFDELQTGHSSDDNLEKWTSTALLLLLSALPVASAFLDEAFDALHVAVWLRGYLMLALAAAMLVFAVITDAMLRVNFKDMDNVWKTSIREFLDNDLQNKLAGVRACMLDFRRFVKWRRYMTYGQTTFQILVVIELAAMALFIGYWAGDEILLAVFLLLLQAAVLLRYSYLRWYYTDFRDPTLQLCVMLAEQNRDYVGVLRRGRP
jgi:hypothetical protein